MITTHQNREARRLMIAQAQLDGLGSEEVWVFEQNLQLEYTWVSEPQQQHRIGNKDVDLLERANEAAALTSIKRAVLSNGRSQSVDMTIHTAGVPHRYMLSLHAVIEGETISGLQGRSIRWPYDPESTHATATPLTTLTHDLRNVLNPMAGLVDVLDTLLPDRPNDPQVQWALHHLMAQIRIAYRRMEDAEGSTSTQVPIPANEPSSVAQDSGDPLPTVSTRSQRVLLVDDDPAQTRGLGALLKHRGFEVETASDGSSCLSRILSFKPEVVFMDLGLGDIDGLDLARAIRETHPDGPRLVATTGRSSQEDTARSLAAGFDGHLVKPVAVDQLMAWLKDAKA